MKVLSLFSGVGGFDMGLENAGMETVFQCEWDKHANTILNKHWPDVPKWDDVSTLTGKHILAGRPIIDVVAWGSPCQDLSVAGKRSGLEGERSGLFHEGIRIIKELRKESNGQYPRISIWENVVGALNSNRGADFGIILDEMAKAGALVIEWAVLDAQHFGVPQRRRRVFVIAIFDPAIAERCPNPLLPVAESLPGYFAKGKPARKSATSKTATSVGTDGGILGSDIVGSLNTSDAKMISSQYVNENKCVVEPVAYHFDSLSSNSMKSSNPDSGVNQVEQARTLDTWRPDPSLNQGGLAIVEPFVKSSRAQTSDDSETWVEGAVNPTLNSFDQGDVRATTAIVQPIQMKNNPVKEIVGSLQARVTATNHESIRDGHAIVEEPMLIDGRRMDDVRVYSEPVQTLEARMGTGGNNVPVIGFSHTQGLDAQPSEKAWPTLRKEGSGHAVAIPIDTRNALRDPEKYDEQNRQGLGIGADGDPMATLTPAHVNAVAYGIQGNVIGRQDHNGPAGKGHTEEGEPMFTLTGTDIHAVAYDEYNDTIGATHHALRAGTKQSTGVLEPTMAVRRLTPLECERLMGWPDDHTRWKADGTEQADTHRYKQCGNGVASPVAQWIAKHLLKI